MSRRHPNKALEELIDCVLLSTTQDEKTHDPSRIKINFTEYAPSITQDEFYDLVKRATELPGVRTSLTIEDLEHGPNYLTFGDWLGDDVDHQHLALRFMALGAFHGVWRVITPQVVGFTGDRIAQAIALGFIMTNGFQKLNLAEW